MGVELRQDLDMDDGGVYSDYDLALHVKDVLLSVSSGDVVSVENYRELVGRLYPRERHSPDDVAKLVASLKGLSGAASYIDSAVHVGLLSPLFAMSLWNYGPDVMDALIELIISLAASSGKYLDLCLAMLTRHFETPSNFLEKLKLPYGLTKKDQVLTRVHSALKDIADVVPLSPARIVTIVSDRLDLYRQMRGTSTHGLVIFVENMLKLEGGALGEVVRVSMLTKVVELLLHLDVEMGSWDNVLQDHGIFQMELEDVDDFTEDFLNDGTEHAREATINDVTLKSFAEKLDTLMVLTFEHLESCEAGGRLSEVFKTLLETFRNKVLTTCKSKFVQFVMFYACALDPVNCGEEFATNLVEIFVYDANLTCLRMRAVAYLASYLSRAMFMSASIVAQTLKRLVGWCFNYVKTKKGGVNPENDKLFYAACQAIMYLLCFRMRSLMDDPQSKSLLAGLPLESILSTEISPLKACVPSIVKEFLWQANAAGLVTAEEFDFADGLESEYSWVWGGKEELHKLFPFDPCLLRNSDRFIRPNFIYWSMVQRTYDEEKEGSSDEDGDEAFAVDNEENVMDYEILQCLEEQQFDEVDNALNKMSITPKDSLHKRFGGAVNKPMRMPSRIRPSTSPESL
ncbi:RNA polymerase I-specific transcription initiation factor RRN3 [Rosa sericea]